MQGVNVGCKCTAVCILSNLSNQLLNYCKRIPISAYIENRRWLNQAGVHQAHSKLSNQSLKLGSIRQVVNVARTCYFPAASWGGQYENIQYSKCMYLQVKLGIQYPELSVHNSCCTCCIQSPRGGVWTNACTHRQVHVVLRGATGLNNFKSKISRTSMVLNLVYINR